MTVPCDTPCCDDSCCESGDICCNDDTCCQSEFCCSGGTEVCPTECCGDECCDLTETCCDGECHEPSECCNSGTVRCDTTCCGDVCCQEGEICSDGQCVELGVTVTAHKFEDLNGNGILDAGEPALSGWEISLFAGSDCAGTALDSDITDGSGNVSFTNLSAGDYSVKETQQAGWQNTTDLCQNVTLAAGGSEIVNFGNQELPQLDFGDAPDSYGTLLASNGARHAIFQGYHMGPIIDAEPDGQPSPLADGDDMNPPGAPDDDDGVTFTTSLVPGQLATVVVDGGPSGGKLDAWIDFHQDGSFAEFSDDIFVNETLNPGPNTLEFQVVRSADPGNTYARFRLSSQGGLGPDGPADDGEVEDYMVAIEDGTPSITIVISSAWPADGTDFDFIGDLGGFTLDSANQDDGDGTSSWITFSNLTPQNYSVTQLLSPGWTVYSGGVSGDSDSGTDMSNWRDGTIIIDLDAGENILFQYLNLKQGAIGDLVWEDINGNGIQDTGEPGIEGITVNLYDCTHGLVDTTTTDSSGIYSFTNIVPSNHADWDNSKRIAGDYYIKFELPSGYTFTGQDQGADDALDSDADPSTGQTACTTIEPGENDLNWDCGLYPDQPTPEPDITVDPTTIDFGIVVGGSQETVTITNVGDDDLIIGNIAQSDGLDYPFSIIEDNCSGRTLGQGESNTITVRIHPSTVGNWTDSFDIPSNDPDENPVTVAVSGSNRSVIQVHTDEGGDIDVDGDGVYENVNGAIFWNGSEFVVNDTYGHMYFWDAENGVRIGNFGIDHTTAYSGGGNNVNVHTCVIGADDEEVFNIMHNTYIYTKIHNCVEYQVEAAEFHFQFLDADTMEPLGTLAIVRSRSANINGTKPYFDVYIKNAGYLFETDMTATYEAFLSDPKWYGFPAGMGFDGVMALSGSDLDPYFKGDFVTSGADYWIDTNGGSEMGGMTYKLTTADYSGPGLMGTGTPYIAEFDYQFKNDLGQLQFESVLPHVYSVTEVGNVCNGSITIIKDANPEDDTSFGFTGDLGAFSLTDPSSNSQTFSDLQPGDYNTTESLPDHWYLTDCNCTGGDSTPLTDGVTVHLDAGEHITCTFTNHQQLPTFGSITVVKEINIGAVADGAFCFDSDLGSFSLPYGGGNYETVWTDLEPGAYTITESTPPQDWTLTGVICSGGDCTLITDGVTVNLNRGEDVTVTFTNEYDEGGTPPVPELPTILLVSLGLMTLGGFIWIKRRRRLTATV